MVEFCYAECNLSQVSCMVSAINKPSLRNVFVLSVIMECSILFVVVVVLSVIPKAEAKHHNFCSTNLPLNSYLPWLLGPHGGQ